MMHKFLILVIIMVAFLPIGCAQKPPVPTEGVYSLKQKTLTFFDLSSEELAMYGNLAELTDSKPDFLEVDAIDLEKISDVKFGSFRLGNNEKKVWFLMTKKSDGYWNNLYIDQNQDNRLTKKEEIKSFQTFQSHEHGYNILRATSLVPVPIRISYKGVTKEYEKALYFFISTVASSKKDENHVGVVAFSASFLEGEMKFAVEKEQRLIKFMIIDTNSNGCYNDYGTDVFFINQKQDGIFHKDESHKLVEFFNSTGDEKSKKQLRLNSLPFSLQLGVTDATDDFDLSRLEPPVNSGNEEIAKPNQPDQQKQVKTDSGDLSNEL